MREARNRMIQTIRTMRFRKNCSEAPHDTSRSSVVILCGGQIMRAEIVALQSPGEVLEENLIVHAAADIDCGRAIGVSTRIYFLNATNGVYERAPFAEAGRQARAREKVILGNS